MKFTTNLLVTSPPGRFSGDVRSRRFPPIRLRRRPAYPPPLYKGPSTGPFFQLPASEYGGAFGRTDLGASSSEPFGKGASGFV